MTHTTFNHYLQQVDAALKRKKGQRASELLSFKDEHITNSTLHIEHPESHCEQWFEQPVDELVAAHIKCLWCISNRDFIQAYGYQSVVVQSFIKEFQSHKEENWALPIMYSTTVDLRLLANRAELQLIEQGGKGKPGEVLEKAAETMMSCFRICGADNRAAIQDSKKWGMLYLINQLFKIYFKINKLHLCKPLIRAIDSSNLKEKFSISQLVTYRYYVGRKAMFESDFKSAENYLSYAFLRCLKSSKQNKRHILIYLLPVKMLLGYMPRITVLKKYNLMQFADIAKATCEGNLRLLERTMADHESFFIKSGVYLILEKLKTISYRNLFKKTFLMMNMHIVPVAAFLTALKFMDQEDVDSDEVECILANLIYKNYIKGYLSHQHNKLVFSKQNAFPALTSFL